MKTIPFNEFKHIVGQKNLWKYNSKYYRLFAKGKTPNGSWLIAPKMRQLKDIKVSNMKDIYGETIIISGGAIGTVGSGYSYIRY